MNLFQEMALLQDSGHAKTPPNRSGFAPVTIQTTGKRRLFLSDVQPLILEVEVARDAVPNVIADDAAPAQLEDRFALGGE